MRTGVTLLVAWGGKRRRSIWVPHSSPVGQVYCRVRLGRRSVQPGVAQHRRGLPWQASRNLLCTLSQSGLRCGPQPNVLSAQVQEQSGAKGHKGGQGKKPILRCVPPEELPPAAQRLSAVMVRWAVHMVARACGGRVVFWTLRGVSAVVWLGFVTEPYTGPDYHGRPRSVSPEFQRLGVPHDAPVTTMAHPAKAHDLRFSEGTQRGLCLKARGLGAGAAPAGEELAGSCAAACRELCAGPPPQQAAQRRAWVRARPGNGRLLRQRRLHTQFLVQHPGVVQAWVAMGPARPPVEAFLAQHAPAVWNDFARWRRERRLALKRVAQRMYREQRKLYVQELKAKVARTAPELVHRVRLPTGQASRRCPCHYSA